MDVFLLPDLESGLRTASDSTPAAAPETSARATGEAALSPAAGLLSREADKSHWTSQTKDSGIRQPEKVAISANGLSGEYDIPIWHPHFKKDAEKLGEDPEMIKGLEKRNFKDRLRVLFSSEQGRLGSDSTTIFMSVEGRCRGRRQLFAVCTDEEERH